MQSLTGETRPQSWAEPLDKRFNLYRIQSDLYRSALPDSEDQPMLKELGVATVINFYQRSDSAWLHDPKVRQIHLQVKWSVWGLEHLDRSLLFDELNSLLRM